jgi:hypothetical protein
VQTGGTAVGPGSVTRYWIYDGFGTVKMPYGTETNVYRIRTKQVDSSSVLNSILATTEELIWFRQSDGIPILRFIKQGPSTIAAYYASVSGVSAISESILDNKLIVYPNPFNDKIILSNLSNKQIKQVLIYDTQRKLVLSMTNFDNKELNTSKLYNGFYTLEIQLEGNTTIHRKLIKESTNR